MGLQGPAGMRGPQGDPGTLSVDNAVTDLVTTNINKQLPSAISSSLTTQLGSYIKTSDLNNYIANGDDWIRLNNRTTQAKNGVAIYGNGLAAEGGVTVGSFNNPVKGQLRIGNWVLKQKDNTSHSLILQHIDDLNSCITAPTGIECNNYYELPRWYGNGDPRGKKWISAHDQ